MLENRASALTEEPWHRGQRARIDIDTHTEQTIRMCQLQRGRLDQVDEAGIEQATKSLCWDTSENEVANHNDV